MGSLVLLIELTNVFYNFLQINQFPVRINLISNRFN